MEMVTSFNCEADAAMFDGMSRLVSATPALKTE